MWPHSDNMSASLFPVSKSRANCHVGAAAAKAGAGPEPWPGVTTSGSGGGHTGHRERGQLPDTWWRSYYLSSVMIESTIYQDNIMNNQCSKNNDRTITIYIITS